MILTRGTPTHLAAQRVTKTVPIVVVADANPVGNGLATTLARPGANITGMSTSATEVRQLAVVIAEKDAGFAALRAKIHNAPNASDAQRVRDYAASAGKSAVDEDYEKIASAIDSLYESRGAVAALLAIADETGDESVARKLRAAAGELEEAADPATRFEIASRILRELRDRFASAAPGGNPAAAR